MRGFKKTIETKEAICSLENHLDKGKTSGFKQSY